jgi:hypothetical protein
MRKLYQVSMDILHHLERLTTDQIGSSDNGRGDTDTDNHPRYHEHGGILGRSLCTSQSMLRYLH